MESAKRVGNRHRVNFVLNRDPLWLVHLQSTFKDLHFKTQLHLQSAITVLAEFCRLQLHSAYRTPKVRPALPTAAKMFSPRGKYPLRPFLAMNPTEPPEPGGRRRTGDDSSGILTNLHVV